MMSRVFFFFFVAGVCCACTAVDDDDDLDYHWFTFDHQDGTLGFKADRIVTLSGTVSDAGQAALDTYDRAEAFHQAGDCARARDTWNDAARMFHALPPGWATTAENQATELAGLCQRQIDRQREAAEIAAQRRRQYLALCGLPPDATPPERCPIPPGPDLEQRKKLNAEARARGQ